MSHVLHSDCRGNMPKQHASSLRLFVCVIQSGATHTATRIAPADTWAFHGRSFVWCSWLVVCFDFDRSSVFPWFRPSLISSNPKLPDIAIWCQSFNHGVGIFMREQISTFCSQTWQCVVMSSLRNHTCPAISEPHKWPGGHLSVRFDQHTFFDPQYRPKNL